MGKIVVVDSGLGHVGIVKRVEEDINAKIRLVDDDFLQAAVDMKGNYRHVI